MHTLSSARRTCMASVSAVECTATVAMPSSRQARNTRNAISPRLAMRIFLNMMLRLLDNEERLVELHGGARGDQNLLHGAGARRLDLVEGLHGLDQQQGGPGLHALPGGHIGGSTRLGGEIG